MVAASELPSSADVTVPETVDMDLAARVKSCVVGEPSATVLPRAEPLLKPYLVTVMS